MPGKSPHRARADPPSRTKPAPSLISKKKRLDSDSLEQFEAQKEQLQIALAELEESRNRYAELFDNAPVGYLTVDGHGKICEINLTAAALFGHDRDRLEGTVLGAFAHSREDRQKLLDHLRACRAKEMRVRTHLVLRAAGGESPLPVELLSHPLENEMDRYHTALVDRREQDKTEAALRDARDAAELAARAKDDFIATLSHELRTPLNPVLLLASENAGNPELSDETRADFGIIAKNVTLEARLIDDLLDLTRIIRGKLSLDRRPTDINVILLDALANVRPELEQKKISVTIQLAEGPHPVFGDGVRLQQVFWNILRNAAKFTPDKGKLSISSRRIDDGRAVILTFVDSGIGMTQEDISHIFDAFAQGSHAAGKSKHQFGGLGLGLTISRKLVELHMGKIEASSEGPTKGSVIAVELPVMRDKMENPAGPVSQARRSDTADGRRRGRLLIVEDHEPTRNLLHRMLVARNFEVTAAACVAEAWDSVAKARFDLLVSDIGLPDGDGYLLMREMRERYGLRGIALTGYGMDDDIKLSKEAGFSAHLTKPIHSKTLDEALEALAI
jgi:PAS domain S-box-containing protein